MTEEQKKAAPDHFICVGCGHEKGAHTRRDRSMGHCCFRPDNDWKKPMCNCKEFE